jgi:hypothetical protein
MYNLNFITIGELHYLIATHFIFIAGYYNNDKELAIGINKILGQHPIIKFIRSRANNTVNSRKFISK